MEVMEITGALCASLLPARPETGHKGTFGAVTVLGGSERYRGAALLCARGAQSCGVGICCLVSVEPVLAAAAVTLPSCTLLPLESEEGCIRGDMAERVLGRPGSLVLGPGLGNTGETRRLVRDLLAGWEGPLVADADGLNGLGAEPALLYKESRPLVLTPHPGEAARLLGVSVGAVTADPAAAAMTLRQLTGGAVVLKGAVTHVAGDRLWDLEAPNSGLAKGGSGDLLAGIIGALLAQGLTAEQAAVAGVWLHSRAGRLAAGDLGEAAMLPEDAGDRIALALAEVTGGEAALAALEAQLAALERRKRLLEISVDR